MEHTITWIIGAAALALNAIVSAVIGVLVWRQKSQNQQKAADIELAMKERKSEQSEQAKAQSFINKQHQALATTLSNEIEKVRTEAEKIRHAHITCEGELAVLRAQNSDQEDRLCRQNQQINKQDERIIALEEKLKGISGEQ